MNDRKEKVHLKQIITLEELKQIELEILKQVDAICIQENVRYSLCGGSLLGAIRHGGFIPWDDDIDIFMPRPDYNKFVEYCKTHRVPFKLSSIEVDSNCSYLYAKAMNYYTTINEINGNRNGVNLGVYIDIFPIDGLGNTYDEAKEQFKKTRFDRELLVAYNWKHFFRSKTHSIVYEPIRFAFFVLSRFVKSEKLIKKIQAKYPTDGFQKSKYAGTICGSYRFKEILPIEVYSEFDTVSFEGYEFMSIKNKDTYLKSIYGNYMELPPKEKRVPHHTFEAYYNGSFTESEV